MLIGSVLCIFFSKDKMLNITVKAAEEDYVHCREKAMAVHPQKKIMWMEVTQSNFQAYDVTSDL